MSDRKNVCCGILSDSFNTIFDSASIAYYVKEWTVEDWWRIGSSVRLAAANDGKKLVTNASEKARGGKGRG